MPDIHIKNKIVSGVYSGIITTKNLPVDVYLMNATKLHRGVSKGYGKVTSTYNDPDYRLYKSLNDNIYMFSAAKTVQQTLAMSEALTDGKRIIPYEEFKEKAGDIFDNYNDNYLNAEYYTAIDSARMADKWQDFVDNADVMPLLQFSTSNDETVCEICAPLDGVILPIDDPFWDMYAIPVHFRCNCDIHALTEEQGTKAGGETDRDELAYVRKSMEGHSEHLLRNNPGKTGMVFTKAHPYFSIPKEYVSFAKQNFGLPIPKHYGNV